MRIRRNTYAIEHVMPQSWLKHWPLTAGVIEAERDARIHRLGNLTLLTKKLNSTVSNGPWSGDTGKAAHLQEKDVLLLNSRLLKDYAAQQWDEPGIDERTTQAISAILAVWPVPPGHKVKVNRDQAATTVFVEIADLLSAGLLTSGQVLFSRPGKYGGDTAQVLSDGRIEVRGQICGSPSQAGIFVRKKSTNGWHFWRLDPHGKQSLHDVLTEYLKVAFPGGTQEDAETDVL